MKRIGVIGHFGDGKNLLNGQTIKTKIVTTELETRFGGSQIFKIDTHGGIKTYIKLPFLMVAALGMCSDIIIMPAHNGVKVIVPLLSWLNKMFHRSLHYVAIGGWLPDLTEARKDLSHHLKKFSGIYVETKDMKNALEEQGFYNIILMPNCKKLDILQKDELIYIKSEPYPLCTFSRVMKEKGIEDAVYAVMRINDACGQTKFTLDIFGQIDGKQEDWFHKLKNTFPPYIQYKGVIPFRQTTKVLKKYYAVLFPTYYEGEGFAGTLIDAMAAGVPVIASDWKCNGEFVKDGETGCLFAAGNIDDLVEAINSTVAHGRDWNQMKVKCIDQAYDFVPENVLKILLNRLRGGVIQKSKFTYCSFVMPLSEVV
jgi:Glycosyltransferase